jgi:hypothetical protein
MTEIETASDPSTHTQQAGGVLVGVLVALAEGGAPWVAFSGNPDSAPCLAQSVVRLTGADIGRRVALLFEGGDRRRPVVLGCMLPSEVASVDASLPASVQVDEQAEQTIVAQHRLVLRCGEASITLQSDGTVHIQGRNLLAEASATHRLRGAAIHLN